MIRGMAINDLRGKFIVFDGPDGCGKSTQARLLGQALEQRGLLTMLVRDPGTTRIGEKIRAILLDPVHSEMGMRCEMLLYMAARAQMMSQVIAPALQQQKVIISDRFVSSTLAYQLGGEGLSAEEIRAAAQIAIQGHWPDLVILLDISPEKSFERMPRDKDRIEQRPLQYHQQVRRHYVEQAERDPSYRVVAADQGIEAVHQRVMEIVLQEKI
jgi:dTMP kinase